MPHSPTRLPYGLSYVIPGAPTSAYVIGTSATPDVSYGTYFVANASNTTITNFAGGERGKIIYLRAETGGVVVIQNSAGGIRANGIVYALSNGTFIVQSSTAGNITMLSGETLHFAHNGTDWGMVGSRVVATTMV